MRKIKLLANGAILRLKSGQALLSTIVFGLLLRILSNTGTATGESFIYYEAGNELSMIFKYLI